MWERAWRVLALSLPGCHSSCLSMSSRRFCFVVLSCFQKPSVFLGSWPHFFLQGQHQLSHVISHHSDHIGHTFIIQDTLPFLGQPLIKFNLICKLKSLLPCKVTYSYVPEIQMWTSLEGHYYAHCNIDNKCLIIGLLMILHCTLGRRSEPNCLKLIRQEVLCV